MMTNLDYLNADKAVKLIKEGTDITSAASQTNANIQIINILISNKDTITSDLFVDDPVRLQRENICSFCEKNEFNTCMECACPLAVIINMKFKKCPLGKW